MSLHQYAILLHYLSGGSKTANPISKALAANHTEDFHFIVPRCVFCPKSSARLENLPDSPSCDVEEADGAQERPKFLNRDSFCRFLHNEEHTHPLDRTAAEVLSKLLAVYCPELEVRL